MRLKNTLSHEVHVTQHQKKDEDNALSVHAHMLCNLRVSLWFVSCLSSVPVLLFMLYSYSFRGLFSVVGDILFTHVVRIFQGTSERIFKELTAWHRSRRVSCGCFTRVKVLSMVRRLLLPRTLECVCVPSVFDSSHVLSLVYVGLERAW